MKIVPNFIIGGPPKCASTSLYFYLKQHPEIFMSPVKQTRFFSMEYDKGIEYYTKNFFSGVTNQKMAGEATPGYFLLPYVPQRIKSFNPDMKMIFCFRNPAERAFSGWNMRVTNGTETLSFHDAMAENLKQLNIAKQQGESSLQQEQTVSKLDEESHRVYIEAGMYATNLKNYYKYFEPSQIKIVFLEELSKDLHGTLKSIFNFLGVDENYVIEKTEQQHTARQQKIKTSGGFMRKLKRALKPFTKMMGEGAKKKINDAMYKKSAAEGSKAKLTTEDRKFAYDIFKDEIDELEKMLNVNLSHWKYTG